MKILVLTSTFSRWKNDTDPKFVDNLCHYLAGENEIHVVAPHTRGTATEEIVNGIKIFRFRYFIEKWQSLAYDGGILPRLKQNKFRILLVPPFLLGQLLLTIRLLRAHDYDLIHAHWIIPQGVVALLARPFARVPPIVVATSHGGDLFALKGRLLGYVKSWVTHRVEHLTVVSSTMKKKALDQGLKRAQDISVIPMGVDAQGMFLPPPEGSNRTGLLFVGRLVDKKGVEYLIGSLPEVLAQHPHETVTIIGSGPLEQSLKESCRLLGIEDRVSFLGSLINTEIPGYLRRAAVTIFPSVVTDDGDQEGTPVAIMEALACECAVIVSDYPGARDIIEDGVNGRLVAQRSSQQLAEQINFLLGNPAIRSAMGRKARQSVRQKYDWQVVGKTFELLFRSLLQKRLTAQPGTDSLL
jgi:glycosyltransferase involved in cell wall biosynthesis